MVGYWSGYWELDKVTDLTTTTVMMHMRRQFARSGVPVRVITDNGPPLSSYDFHVFARQWNFHYKTSSTYHPASNGKTESAIKTGKSLILKAQEEGRDAWQTILAYRNTLTQGMSTTPTERMMGRKARTLLPTKVSTLVRTGSERVQEELERKQEKQASYYDRKACDLLDLEVDEVRIKPRGGYRYWRPATVVEKVAPRSYCVRLKSGRVLRRNRVQLRKVKSPRESKEREHDSQQIRSWIEKTEGEEVPPEAQEQGKEFEEDANKPGEYRTRSGRLVRPPRRWGFED